MIQITLLKTQHSGLDEAVKLKPFIDNCDALGLEISCTTLADAQRQEIVYRNRNSRVTFIPHEQRLYINQRQEFIFENQTPILILERFSEQEAARLQELDSYCDTIVREAYNFLKEQKVDLFLKRYYFARQVGHTITNDRDREIARNIINSENLLRSIYGDELQKKDPLRFVCSVGGAHTPENYCTIPMTVIDIMPPPATIQQRSERQEAKDVSEQELRKYTLDLGILQLCKDFNFKLTEGQIMQSSEEELIRLIPSILKTQTI